MKKKLSRIIILFMFVFTIICYSPFNSKEDNIIDLFNAGSNELYLEYSKS
ncbi:hypothetical protein [uncultured Anaerococcus sp.]|nr:hypothetical protein [uncultured Anaerococcus sp.]